MYQLPPRIKQDVEDKLLEDAAAAWQSNDTTARLRFDALSLLPKVIEANTLALALGRPLSFSVELTLSDGEHDDEAAGHQPAYEHAHGHSRGHGQHSHGKHHHKKKAVEAATAAATQLAAQAVGLFGGAEAAASWATSLANFSKEYTESTNAAVTPTSVASSSFLPAGVAATLSSGGGGGSSGGGGGSAISGITRNPTDWLMHLSPLARLGNMRHRVVVQVVNLVSGGRVIWAAPVFIAKLDILRRAYRRGVGEDYAGGCPQHLKLATNSSWIHASTTTPSRQSGVRTPLRRPSCHPLARRTGGTVARRQEARRMTRASSEAQWMTVR